MAPTSSFRGHPTVWDEAAERWRYADTGEFADFDAGVRPCKNCGLTFQGSNVGDPDPCLGNLPGVDNACCGHGVRENSYVRFTNGVVLTGFVVGEL